MLQAALPVLLLLLLLLSHPLPALARICSSGECGNHCQASCPINCATSNCLARCTCLGFAGSSTSAATHCKPGFYGMKCASTCPSNCAQQVCTRGGMCVGFDASSSPTAAASHCKPGFAGNTCGGGCGDGHCAAGACARDGGCLGYERGDSASPATHCQAGFYGKWCKHACPEKCAVSMCSKSGQCLGSERCAGSAPAEQCKPGFYSTTCSRTCPENCAKRVCANDGGCVGYDRCSPSAPASHCRTGFYKKQCDRACPTAHCAQSGCTVNGRCIGYASGGKESPATHCQSGYYGSTCGYKCPAKCPGMCLKSGKCPDDEDALSIIMDPLESEASSDCKPPAECDSVRGALAPSPECAAPNGKSSCSFYMDCLDKAHPCGEDGYTRQFGNPMCEAFLKLDKDTAVDATVRTWMRGVRQCLQEQAVKFVYSPSMSCDEVSDAAFASHVGCYTRADNNVCNLVSSWRHLATTIGTRLFSRDVVSNGAGVMSVCAQQWWAWVRDGIVTAVEHKVGDVVEAFKDAVSDTLVKATRALFGTWMEWTSSVLIKSTASTSIDLSAQAALWSLGEFALNVSVAARQSENSEMLIRVAHDAGTALHDFSVCSAHGGVKCGRLDLSSPLDALATICQQPDQRVACGSNATSLLFDIFYATQ